YTFTVELTAPAAPGSYLMQWQMLEDAVEWFGATTPPVSIEVGDAAAGCQRSSGANAASFVSQDVPDQVEAGSTFTISVTMQNSGTTTWSRLASKGYFLGSQGAQDNF